MKCGAWLLLGPILLGCSAKTNHAPPASNECAVQAPDSAFGACRSGGSTVGGIGAGGGGGGGGVLVDGGSIPVTGDASVGILSGRVLVFEDSAFLTSHPYGGSGTVTVFDSGGPIVRRTASFSGSTYATSVPLANALWVGIQSSTNSEVMSTLQLIDGRSPSAADVAFAQTTAMSLIFTSLQTSIQSMRSDRAQIVVRFVDSTGSPVQLVQIALPPTGAIVAYDSGALYSDLPNPGSTQNRGTAVLLNAPAPVWPGGKLTLNFQSGSPAVLGKFDVYVAQGAVTFATVAATK